MANKRFDYRSLVEIRIPGDGDLPGSGYVYSKDHNARLGFSPRSTVTHDPANRDQVAVWQTNWGTPTKDEMRVMFHALTLAYPGKLISST